MNSLRPLVLLTLDLDDTLWPCLETLGRAEQALQAWLDFHAPRLTATHDPARLHTHRRGLMRDHPELAHDLTAVRRASLRALLTAAGHAASLADEAMAVFLHHRNQVVPYPDVIPVLRALAADYRLVSLTNGNADPARTPLRGLFHRSLNAAGVGAAKPDPALFQAALAWAGVAAEQALHAGDDPYLDVQAARACGLRAVWINRTGRSWPRELAPPLAEFENLRALQAWLRAR